MRVVSVQPPRVLSVIAGTLYGNRGAQAMTETVIGWVREQDPTATFHLFTYYPTEDRDLLSPDAAHVTVHSSTPKALVTRLLVQPLLIALLARVVGRRRALRWAPADVRAIGESSALVDVAGVSFVGGRERFLPFNILTLWPAWVLGVPVVKMSQAVGPFDGRVNRAAAALVLPRVTALWARGERTYDHVAGTPALASVPLMRGDDIAFAHRDEFALTDEPGKEALADVLAAIARRRDMPGVRAVVGLCPSSVVAVRSRASGGDYENVLTGVVRSLASAGVQVVLFPNATRAADPAGERNNDLPLIRRVLSAVGPVDGPAPFATDLDLSATSIKAVIAACDAVVVSRFHAMVGALSLAVPVVVLGWSHKYVEVMSRFGQEERVSDYKTLSTDDIVDSVEDLLTDAGGVSAAIRAALPDVTAGAQRPLAGLLQDDLGVEPRTGAVSAL